MFPRLLVPWALISTIWVSGWDVVCSMVNIISKFKGLWWQKSKAPWHNGFFYIHKSLQKNKKPPRFQIIIGSMDTDVPKVPNSLGVAALTQKPGNFDPKTWELWPKNLVTLTQKPENFDPKTWELWPVNIASRPFIATFQRRLVTPKVVKSKGIRTPKWP